MLFVSITISSQFARASAKIARRANCLGNRIVKDQIRWRLRATAPGRSRALVSTKFPPALGAGGIWRADKEAELFSSGNDYFRKISPPSGGPRKIRKRRVPFRRGRSADSPPRRAGSTGQKSQIWPRGQRRHNRREVESSGMAWGVKHVAEKCGDFVAALSHPCALGAVS